jgi:hypothetical protein
MGGPETSLDLKYVELVFRVEGHDSLTAGEFAALFKYVDSLGRSLIEEELAVILEDLGAKSRERLSELGHFQYRFSTEIAPVEIRKVERGSWIIVASIASSAIYWIFKNFITPTAVDAWKGSPHEKALKKFMRDKMFGGAKENVERTIRKKRRPKNFTISDVRDRSLGQSRQVFEVTLERKEVIKVRYTEKEMVDEVLSTIQNRRRRR